MNNATAAPARVWQMTKLRPGRYTLLSNNRSVMFLIEQYEEDGTAERMGADGAWHPVYGKFWQVSYCRAADLRNALDVADTIDEAIADVRWTAFSSSSRTRNAAIDAAMTMEQGQ